MNYTDHEGGPTPLIQAILKEQEQMIKFFLQHQADLAVVDEHDNTMIHLGAAVGQGLPITAAIMSGI